MAVRSGGNFSLYQRAAGSMLAQHHQAHGYRGANNTVLNSAFAAVLAGRSSKQDQVRRKQFIFEKKNQKTFVYCPFLPVEAENIVVCPTDKSFLLAFSEKNCFPWVYLFSKDSKIRCVEL